MNNRCLIRKYNNAVREVTVYIANKPVQLFMQEGFFNCQGTFPPLHKHMYPEIHVLGEGNATFEVNGNTHHIAKDEALFIPANLYHRRISLSNNAKITAFQLSDGKLSAESIKLPDGYGRILINEIECCTIDRIENRLSGLLTFVCASFLKDGSDLSTQLQDRRYIINEFFSNNYDRDLQISDLSVQLGLSDKQTQRTVKEYTGNTFRDELTRVRMEVARQMYENDDLPLTKIAEKVGYQSYSGFWKAFNKVGD